MSARALLGLLSLLWATTLQAEPLVIGFERFNSEQPSAEGGRLLYNELGCVNCHGGATGLPMRRGPQLTGVTQRIQADWLRNFLSDPARAHSGSNMPQFSSLGSAEDVEAILHYLGDLPTKPAKKPKKVGHVNAEHGKELFHTMGCVACHGAAKDFQPSEGAPKPQDFTYPAIAFPELQQKYGLQTLAEFLRDPLQTRPDGRMPRIDMEESDALDLAGYLLEFASSDGESAPKLPPFAVDHALALRGRGIVAAAGCAACHELPKDVGVASVALHSGAGGCLEGNAGRKSPQYQLGTKQRASLKLYLAEREKELPQARVAELTLQALNCAACHERDGRGGPDLARKAYFQGDHNLGDTGRYPPPLTGVGRKLQPEWLSDVLEGKARVRPYLQTKMPVYGAATSGLAALLSVVDAKTQAALPGGDDAAGRKLMGTQGGVGCITCHRWGAHAALGIQALDLSSMGQRLQPGWLRDYLINPAAYRPGTLMPSFWPEGKAANGEILGGDTERQIASIYAFAKSDNGEPEGFPAVDGGEFELKPLAQPIVQRTFFADVGTHAILVGFPHGVNLAYDGKTGRPARAWRGRFFDAYTTWFSRFAPFEKPLGDSVVKWPSSGGENVRFEGYRLDAQKVPVFLLKVNGSPVADRFDAIDGGLKRTLTGTVAALNALAVTHPDGVVVQEENSDSKETRIFTYLWK